jgi:uncharacterized protein
MCRLEAYQVTNGNWIRMESKMKILLIGATGMVGSRILAEARARGHDVVAAARKPVAGGVVLDASDAAAVTVAAAGVDVIVAATSPRSTGDAMAEAGAVGRAVMQAAQGKRLVYVGGAGSLQMPDGSPVIDTVPAEYAAEARALMAVRDRLQASALDWTYMCPPFVIAPGVRTGVYRGQNNVILFAVDGSSTISAEDYAVAMLDELETPKHRRQIYTVGY